MSGDASSPSFIVRIGSPQPLGPDHTSLLQRRGSVENKLLCLVFYVFFSSDCYGYYLRRSTVTLGDPAPWRQNTRQPPKVFQQPNKSTKLYVNASSSDFNYSTNFNTSTYTPNSILHRYFNTYQTQHLPNTTQPCSQATKVVHTAVGIPCRTEPQFFTFSYDLRSETS